MYVCVYKLRFVRVAFSISHTPGGHLPPEAKSRFGRAWLSIMYNRDTSAPSAPLFAVYLSGVSARGMPPFMSTRTRYVAFRLPGTDTPTDRFIVPAACSLAIRVVTVGGPRWSRVTYLLRRDRGECLPPRLLTRKPFVFHFFRSIRSDLFFSGTTHKDAGAFSMLFLFFRQILPY